MNQLIQSNLQSLIPPDFWLWLLVGVMLFVGLFLLLREFWCWYWKINERISLLEKIENNTQQSNVLKIDNKDL